MLYAEHHKQLYDNTSVAVI